MRTLSKPQDSKAAEITFGVEIETMIPDGCGVWVGNYHVGKPVRAGRDQSTGEIINAPSFRGAYWRGEKDSSIVCDRGYQACEFVSPVLAGDEGLAKLREMVSFINRIGAKVNHSCGLHITVGIQSVIGTSDHAAVAAFIQKLAHIANHNAWAIYAQTGTNRHINTYSYRLDTELEKIMADIKRASGVNGETLVIRAERRRMVNFHKAFNGERGAIEFRAFAGTLNEAKIMHHLATALGLMRRAHLTQTFGRFQKSEKKHKAKTAVEALRRMWRVLGWVDSVPGRDCALGLYGSLYSEFWSYRKAALQMARKFEERFPSANL